MPALDAVREGERIMTICNACRYCEGFCAVFPAMERRLSFAEADMNYLANLCHNCSECLHACQYTAPHPFAVNVPQTLARIRLHTYEKYCWPGPLASAFRHHGMTTVLALVGVLTAALLAASRLIGRRGPTDAGAALGFYAVIPHGVMATAFGVVFLLVLAVLIVGVVRYLRDTGSASDVPVPGSLGAGLRDALTLRYLHSSGADCTTRESRRGPWRRWSHHLTFYGFMLCFAATVVASVYHTVFGWQAPYALSSVPVLLGTVGGIGLLVGPLGLWMIREGRDSRATDPAQRGLERGFMLLLLLTSATGLALLAGRDGAAMGTLLVVHLAVVLALFVTLPYGKFVHGLYRAAALIRSARETARDSHAGSME